jgi:hypothetical protein
MGRGTGRKLWSRGAHFGVRPAVLRRFGSCMVATMTFTGSLVSPGTAGATKGYVVYPGGVHFVLPVKRTDGYVVSLSTRGQSVKLKLDGTPLAVEYSTDGRVSSHRIDARFGSLGRVKVKLRLNRRPLGAPHEGRCRGRAPIYWEGTYRGRVELPEGGGGVPSGSATHGHVYVTRRFRQVCKRLHGRSPAASAHGALKAEVAVLDVSGQTSGRFARIRALEVRAKRRPAQSTGYLDATVSEKLNGMRVTRRIGMAMTRRLFELSFPGEAPEIARIELAAPFDGYAVFSDGAGTGSSWTGDLSVELPTIGKIALTGSDFVAELCRARSVRTLALCSGT